MYIVNNTCMYNNDNAKSKSKLSSLILYRNAHPATTLAFASLYGVFITIYTCSTARGHTIDGDIYVYIHEYMYTYTQRLYINIYCTIVFVDRLRRDSRTIKMFFFLLLKTRNYIDIIVRVTLFRRTAYRSRRVFFGRGATIIDEEKKMAVKGRSSRSSSLSSRRRRILRK